MRVSRLIASIVLAHLLGSIGEAGASGFWARERVHMVGSSLAYTFASQAAKSAANELPIAEPSFTVLHGDAPFSIFCEGLGPKAPDLLIAHRTLSAAESANCRRNGVRPVRMDLGFSGIALTLHNSEQAIALTRRDLFLALGRDIPIGERQLMSPNPNRLWSDVRNELPNAPILVWGPPLHSVLGEAFLSTVIAEGAQTFAKLDELARSDPNTFAQLIYALRSDGAFLAAPKVAAESEGANDEADAAGPVVEVVDLAHSNDRGLPKQTISLDGAFPDRQTIWAFDYPASWPVVVYVKAEHVVLLEDLAVFAEFLTADSMIGPGGALEAQGLVVAPQADRTEAQTRAASLRIRP